MDFGSVYLEMVVSEKAAGVLKDRKKKERKLFKFLMMMQEIVQTGSQQSRNAAPCVNADVGPTGITSLCQKH